MPLAKGVNTFCWVMRLHDKKERSGGRKHGHYVMHTIATSRGIVTA